MAQREEVRRQVAVTTVLNTFILFFYLLFYSVIIIITNLNWDTLLSDNDAEITSQKFTENLQSKIKKFTVRIKRKRKKHSLPWVTDNIIKLMKWGASEMQAE